MIKKSKHNLSSKLQPIIILLFILNSSVSFYGCWFYSFSGASVPSHLKTISIPVIENRSGSAFSGVTEIFTNTLREDFINDNTFQLSDRENADALLECIIISIFEGPSSVAQGEQVRLNKINISVKAVYRDLVKKKIIYEKTFSDFGEYNASGSIVEREAALENAIEKISDNILLDTVSGW